SRSAARLTLPVSNTATIRRTRFRSSRCAPPASGAEAAMRFVSLARRASVLLMLYRWIRYETYRPSIVWIVCPLLLSPNTHYIGARVALWRGVVQEAGMERSFAREVGNLSLGAGQVFHGEGILAVTKALLQSGVSYIGGYQGAPVSHLIDVLGDAQGLLQELGIYFENSASEAGAAAMLGASIHYPVRGAVTWKSTVGTNVASDALSNLASAGVTGGALIILGEDYGDGSSIIQERTHAFAMKSQIWLMDPRPNLASIVDAVEQAFELSEASQTPVMMQLRIRACHVHGSFVCQDNVAPQVSTRLGLRDGKFDYAK